MSRLRSVRWLLAVASLLAFAFLFALTWWLCERWFGLDTQSAVTVAAAVVTILGIWLGIWQAFHHPQPPPPHPPPPQPPSQPDVPQPDGPDGTVDPDELVIYKAPETKRVRYDFKGTEGYLWTGRGKEARQISERGIGNLKIEDGGILSIERTNTEGRYEVRLQNYLYRGRPREVLPKNLVMAGRRQLRVRCEAKVTAGQHTLRFVLKDVATQDIIDDDRMRITQNDWEPIDLCFQVDPALDCFLRIDDQEVSTVPSSVQIRRVLLTERKL